MIRYILGLALAAGLAGPAATASVYCPYEAFTPPNVNLGLRYSFDRLGLSIVPGSLVGNSAPAREVILRGAEVVGGINYTEDIRAGKAQLAFVDATGTGLALLTEQVAPCPGANPSGMCEVTVFQTEIGSAPTQTDHEFRAVWGNRGLQLERYGKPTNPVVWRADFQEALGWLLKTYETTTRTVALSPGAGLDALRLALLADPLLSKHLHLLRFVEGPTGITVVGRVPSNAIYSLIVLKALDAGVYVRMNVTIDTRLAQAALLPPPNYVCAFDLY